jgi:diphthine synthase
MLTLVGLGLGDWKDITLRGKEAIEDADAVFAEFYTSRLINSDVEKLERAFGIHITLLERDAVESGDMIIRAAENGNAVLLVAGDPLMATTHVSLLLMARERGIETRIVHNASIVTAAPGLLGLQNYKFGRTVSLPFPQENYFPTSAYDFIARNKECGLHTLVLLDINPRPMTANEAMQLLLRMEDVRKEGLISENTLVAVVARAGSEDCLVRAGPLGEMIKEDFGPPLHALVLPGSMHFAEEDALRILAGLR